MFKTYAAIALLLFISLSGYAQQSKIDSLEKLLPTLTADTARIDVLLGIARGYLYLRPQKNIDYAQQAADLAKQTGDLKREAYAINSIGTAYWSKSEYNKAMQYWQQSLDIAHSIGNRELIARNLGNFALIYTGIEDHASALDYNWKALSIFLTTNNTERIGVTYFNLGEVYMRVGNYDSAQYYYQKAIDVNALQGYYGLGVIASVRGSYEKAVENLKKGLALARSHTNKRGEAIVFRWWAEVNLAQNKLDSALIKARHALDLAQGASSKEWTYKAYETLSKVHFARKNFQDAYIATEMAKHYKDSTQSQTTRNALQVHEYERKQGEIAVLQAKQAQQATELQSIKQQQQWIIFSVVAGLLSVCVIALYIQKSRQKEQASAAMMREKNQELTATLESLHVTQEQLQRKNDDITASIQYARRIQQAMLPATERIVKALPEHFIFFSPRDIVSGDFYWWTEQDDKYIIVAADCTGHGVPGAFMSMIGSELLNQIINVQGITSPDIILQKLHSGISTALNQQESANRDGMDMALCTIDLTNRVLEYAGAMNPLYCA